VPAVPTGSPLGPLSQAADRVLADLAVAVDHPEVRAQVLEVRAGLAEPLRVAVAGRVKAGKSTLVNALLRQRVAPTDVGECTRLVTWYRHGVPERLEVVRRDGGREVRPLQADGSLPSTLGLPIDEVQRLEVYLSIDDLRRLTLIDTPGLQSANDDLSSSTRELLAIDEASRHAVSAADVLLLVMALEPHQDDVDTLARFDAQFGGLTRNALNALGVLSRIDHQGVGVEEVADRAAALAARFADHHHLSLAAVVPVNGLLAEATRCGVLTERDVAGLAALAELSAAARRLLLLSADRFVESEAPVSRTDRLRLLEVLDLYGIERALERLAAGDRGASGLGRSLEGMSGVQRLADEVFERFGRRADAFKAGWALAALGHLRGRSSIEQQRIASAVEALELAPGMHAVALLRAAQQLGAGELRLPDALAADLVALAEADLAPDPADAAVDPAVAGSATVAGIGRWRSFANDGRAGPLERQVADVVVRSLEARL
jgi:hypothetical protein